MSVTPAVSRTLSTTVARELHPGETIVWMDMPVPRYFTPASTSAFLFAIPWTAFALFWICGAAGFKFPDFTTGVDLFPLFGIPFVLIGIGMLSSPLWAYRKATRTVYVITDKRAITFEGGRTMTIRSYPPDTLHEIFREERNDGSGDVVITQRVWRDSDGDTRSEPLGFLRVRRPKEVEAMLQKLASQGGGQKA